MMRLARHPSWMFVLAVALPAAGAFAAERSGGYPARPIRLIIPFPPGGGNDTMARAIGAKLTEAWSQPVIFDNRPGANGLLACEIAAKSAPDGYTLLMANVGSHAINPALYSKIPYDPVKDFTPVSLLGTTSNVLVVPTATPAASVSELVALAKAKPRQLTYGSNGIGSSQHLAGVLFGTSFGIEIVHVPYKGTGPMITDLIGGQIHFSFANSLAVTPHVRSNRLRALAVTSLRRSPALPNVPAIAETVPGFEAVSWWGIAAPARTPPSIVTALNTEIVRGLASASMKEQLERQGVEARSTTPAEFAAFIQSELAKWSKVVKDSGARAD
jgi:tripartite-type tricarboxylate transporter receptor subunit TctC